MTRSSSSDGVAADRRSRRGTGLVESAAEDWWETPEGLETRRRIDKEVRERHLEALGRAGPVRRALLELRIRNEIAAECRRILWAED